jgi:hypothetical protein
MWKYTKSGVLLAIIRPISYEKVNVSPYFLTQDYKHYFKYKYGHYLSMYTIVTVRFMGWRS